MPTRLWSIELEGDRFGSSLLIDKMGRVVVSTTRSVESGRPGGMTHLTTTTIGAATTTTYSNVHALRCYVIDPGGRVEWTADDVNVKAEAPDGRLVASNDRHDLLVLDRDGHREEQRPVGEAWWVIGWNGMQPVSSTNPQVAWVAPHLYSLHDRHLHVIGAAGEVLAKTPIPREPFDALLRDREVAGMPDLALFPPRLDLTYHPQAGRLIASHWSLFAWTMSLGLDGAVDWVALPSESCCNSISFVGDALIAHASSCGRRLTFLTTAGVVHRSHEVELHGAFANGHDGVCVRGEDSVTGFDATGEQQWRIDIPDVGHGAARDGVLYVLSGDRTRLELAAFDLR